MKLLKKRTKCDEYFIEMLDKEREYRRATSGGECDEPIVTPLLFQLLDMLLIVCALLGVIAGILAAG